MNQWFLMLIYIVHNGVIGANSAYTVADLYPSEGDCDRVLHTVHLAADQHGTCLPVATMNGKGITVDQAEWLMDQYVKTFKH